MHECRQEKNAVHAVEIFCWFLFVFPMRFSDVIQTDSFENVAIQKQTAYTLHWNSISTY